MDMASSGIYGENHAFAMVRAQGRALSRHVLEGRKASTPFRVWWFACNFGFSILTLKIIRAQQQQHKHMAS